MRRWVAAWLAATVLAGTAHADGGGGLLVFPKVASDAGRDTLIQLVNLSDEAVQARCFYVSPEREPAAFALSLARLQPTLWSVAAGRPLDPSDLRCGDGNLSCTGAGLDPGEIPSQADDFAGALWCVQTSESGAPVAKSALVGQATIETIDGDAARYSALALASTDRNDGDGTLCLGGGPRPGCPAGAEYEGCPESWILQHLAEETIDPLTRDGTVRVELSSVVCTQDLANPGAGILLAFSLSNELEQSFSAASTIGAWASFGLGETGAVFRRSVIGSDHVLTRVRGAGAGASGVLLVAEVWRDNGDGTSRAGVRLLDEGTHDGGDVLRLPEGTDER